MGGVTDGKVEGNERAKEREQRPGEDEETRKEKGGRVQVDR